MAEQQRYCLVTGAAGGIGHALVQAFEKAGYRVIAVDCCRQPTNLVCYAWHELDLRTLVTDEQLAATFFAWVRGLVAENGIHVLINNAAVQILGGVDSLSREQWHQTLDVNLVAPFLLTQGLLAQLEQVSGSIINVGSIHARLTKRNFVAYATSKAALAGMTRAMAVDLGSRVRINAIEPAAIETPMLRAGFNGREREYQSLAECHPLQRIGRPEEIAHLAVVIVEEKMAFLHGACISLDGGISNRLFDPE